MGPCAGRRGAPVVSVDPAKAEAYHAAWEAWQKQLQTLHRVFLEGEPMGAPQLKGLLNREARAKARYDEARLKLLGIPAGAASGDAAAVAAPGPPGPAASASRAGGAP